jgi:hypothetical protein
MLCLISEGTKGASEELFEDDNAVIAKSHRPVLVQFAPLEVTDQHSLSPAHAAAATSIDNSRTSPTQDADLMQQSTRVMSASHISNMGQLSSSISTLRTSAHTFASIHLPNLSFSHIAHVSATSSDHIKHHISHLTPHHPHTPRSHQQQLEHSNSNAVPQSLQRPQMRGAHQSPHLSPRVPPQDVSPTSAAVISPTHISCTFDQKSPAYSPDDVFGVFSDGDDFLELKSSTLEDTDAWTEADGVGLGIGTFYSDDHGTGVPPLPHAHASAAVKPLTVAPADKNRGDLPGLAKSARDRSMLMHKARLEHFRDKQEISNLRQQQALERRQFLADHQNLRQAASWSVMVLLALSGSTFQRIAFDLTARRRRRQRAGGVHVYPVVLLGMRRALRRARLRLHLNNAQYAPPSIISLRSDRVLAMFDEQQLSRIIPTMTLRYFFPNEAIIIIGCEDDEGYVLANGAADITMSTSNLGRVHPGMVFGTAGMISGEMRSASVVARGEGCLAWVMKRSAFDIPSESAVVNASLEALAQLRETNFHCVYKPLLGAAGLRSFPLFHGLPYETLTNLIANAAPRVVGSGTVIADPRQPVSTVSHLFLLKGYVSVKCSAISLTPPEGGEERLTIAGEMRNAIDLPKRTGGKRDRASSMPHPAILLGEETKGLHPPHRWEGRDEYRVCAPALLNVSSLFFPGGLVQTPPFVITAITNCDFMSLSRESLLQPQDAAVLRRNALNAHAEFTEVETKRDVAMRLIDVMTPLFPKEPLAQSTLAQLRCSAATDSFLGPMSYEKWVYTSGETVRFDRSSKFMLNIVIDGTLVPTTEPTGMPMGVRAGASTSVGLVWPSLPDAWFAARDVSVIASTRTVCVRLPRRDVMSWFCRALPNHEHFREACLIFATNTSAVNRLAFVHGCSMFDLDCNVFPDANCPLLNAAARQFTRDARNRGLSCSASDASVADVLRSALNYVEEKLLNLQRDNRSNDDDDAFPTRVTEVLDNARAVGRRVFAPKQWKCSDTAQDVSPPASPHWFFEPSPPLSVSPHGSISPSIFSTSSPTTTTMTGLKQQEAVAPTKFQVRPIQTALTHVSSIPKVSPTSQLAPSPQPPRESPPLVISCRSFTQFTKFGSTSPKGGALPPASTTLISSPRSFASLPTPSHSQGGLTERNAPHVTVTDQSIPRRTPMVVSSPSLRPLTTASPRPRGMGSSASGSTSSAGVLSPRVLTSTTSGRFLPAGAGGVSKGVQQNRE